MATPPAVPATVMPISSTSAARPGPGSSSTGPPMTSSTWAPMQTTSANAVPPGGDAGTLGADGVEVVVAQHVRSRGRLPP